MYTNIARMPILERLKNLSSSRGDKNQATDPNERLPRKGLFNTNSSPSPSASSNAISLKNTVTEHSTADTTRTSTPEKSSFPFRIRGNNRSVSILNDDTSAKGVDEQPNPSSTISLPERLWNNAYGSLKKDNAKLIQAYEVLLTKEIRGDAAEDNLIADDVGRRRGQMLEFISSGLERTEKEAARKQRVARVVRGVAAVKDAIATGLKPSPEATLVWTALTATIPVGTAAIPFCF